MIDFDLINEGVFTVHESIPDANNQDIVSQIKAAINKGKYQVKDFANNLDENDNWRKLFNALKKRVKYKSDFSKYKGQPDNIEDTKLPSALLRDGVGDCKSFTTFMGSVAKNFKDPVYLRLIYYTKEDFDLGMAHIYPYIVQDGKKIFLDVVNGKYNQEEKYYKKEDFKV